ncbi:MAG: pyrroline-5-carboxylate reductase, partial [Mobilicoccus sp.]|nr:pyrroline-5-carboxylate reductase [Mobilicoccus sp.]
FVGAGVMGGAVLRGMVAAGMPTDRLVVSVSSEKSAQAWREEGIEVAGNAEAARGADIVVVGVKPYAMADVVAEVAGEIDGVVVSLAAGVRLETLAEAAGAGVAVMRVMPNTPALVGEGVFTLTPGEHCTDAQIEAVTALLSSCGLVERVPESLQDATSALSGSGPAYLFYVADALVEGGVFEGIPRPLATRLAVQTLLGAATMLSEGDVPAAALREQVTSPGGSTARALRALDEGAVRHHLSRAVSAAAAHAARMGG